MSDEFTMPTVEQADWLAKRLTEFCDGHLIELIEFGSTHVHLQTSHDIWRCGYFEETITDTLEIPNGVFFSEKCSASGWLSERADKIKAERQAKEDLDRKRAARAEENRERMELARLQNKYGIHS